MLDGIEAGNVCLAFALTAFAGLSTGIGAVLAFFTQRTNTRFLSIALGFSAGVMIFVSLVEILPKAGEILAEALGNGMGEWVNLGAFVGGMALIAIIDRLVPSYENPHEAASVEEIDRAREGVAPSVAARNARLERMGVMTAVAIAIHNFPEGFATFLSAMVDPALGVSVAVAVAIHNIPEGVAVAIPIYYATGSRLKAFLYSFMSGVFEPLGALLGYLALSAVMSDLLFGVAFAGVAGIMVFISFDELLPGAREYGEHHLSIYGLVAGMIVMGASLVLLS